jgi:hypothetical protein
MRYMLRYAGHVIAYAVGYGIARHAGIHDAWIAGIIAAGLWHWLSWRLFRRRARRW